MSWIDAENASVIEAAWEFHRQIATRIWIKSAIACASEARNLVDVLLGKKRRTGPSRRLATLAGTRLTYRELTLGTVRPVYYETKSQTVEGSSNGSDC
jgi:hypothetical protein